MRKSKADQTVEGICIILSNISKATAFLHQGVTHCGFRITTGPFAQLLFFFFATLARLLFLSDVVASCTNYCKSRNINVPCMRIK